MRAPIGGTLTSWYISSSAHPHIPFPVFPWTGGFPVPNQRRHGNNYHNPDCYLRALLSVQHHRTYLGCPVTIPEPSILYVLAPFLWKFSRRTYRDHSTGGKNTPISTDMKEGRVQLAMDYSDDRKHRDARAIEWIVDDLTEDSELELLVRNIPDSFNSTWGKDVLQAVTDDKGRRILVRVSTIY